MSTSQVLSEKLGEYNEWISNIAKLDAETVKQYRTEIKLKGRNFIKFHAEVKLLNDQSLIADFSRLMTEFRNIRDISNGRVPRPKAEEESKAQSPAPTASGPAKQSVPEQEVCAMGKDCGSSDPQHFYDVIHFDHPKADQMIARFQKMLKKQKNEAIFAEHQKNKQMAAGDFMTDEELAQQLQAMQSLDGNAAESLDRSSRSKRARKPRPTVTYIDDDGEEDKDDSSSDDDDDDEDFDENEARRTYRRKVRSKQKEDERRKQEEAAMDAEELEKLRKQRLDKLLTKTKAYMNTLTRRVRKNFNDGGQQNGEQLSTNEVREFLSGENDKTAAIEQTKSLSFGTLKDYQRVGLRWMVTLNRMRLNGILADEMGLGKTVQVMALLAYILDTDGVRGKHLIVAPLSTLSSWRDHFAKWLPALNVYLHRGVAAERRERLLEIAKDGSSEDVVVSTYQMVIRDAETMNNVKWCYLIVDEAHTLKNAAGRLFGALNAFSTRHRLLLTGTPLQNNLGELWSLLNFILPAIFDSAQSFDSWFCSPFQRPSRGKKEKNAPDVPMTDEERLMVMDRLHRAIDPFLLRRMKKSVLPAMVKKEEIVLKVPMSGMQAAVYDQLQKYGALRYKGESQRHGFNNVMMQLRKCANHPFLFAPDDHAVDEDIYRSAGKFVVLRHLIPKMKRFEHRMLIFCQFMGAMDLLGEMMDFLGEKYFRIDGSTPSEDRIDFLEQFNAADSDCAVFLLSTRACGLGLNLWTADTVILFDSDWNPQQDLQAMARCHRIGQKREVRIFRLIADGSIEESIIDRAQKKLDLERKAIECGKFDFSITGSERKDFLKEVLAQRVEVDNKYSSDIERKELNKLLSRSEAEWAEFERMDSAKDGAVALAEALLTERVLPQWLEEITTAKDARTPLPEKRRRKKVDYTGKSQWKEIEKRCLETEDGDEGRDDDEEEEEEDAVAEDAKKKRRMKRKRKRKGDDDENDDEEGPRGADKTSGNGKKRRKVARK